MSKMDHPNVIRLHGLINTHEFLILVLDVWDEGSLHNVLKKTDSPFSVADRIQIATDVASALVHAHSCKIIHRDIKAQNVLLKRSDGVWVACLADFGIARIESVSTMPTVQGTPW